MHKVFSFLFLIILAVPIKHSLGSDVTSAHDKRKPRCEARNARAPGRLNIDSSAIGFNIKSCKSIIGFYIAKNTSLRSISGTVDISQDDVLLDSYELNVDFEEPAGGLFSYKHELSVQKIHGCHKLDILLSKLECFNQHGIAINCPAIRLKKSHIFKDLTIEKNNLDICFDD